MWQPATSADRIKLQRQQIRVAVVVVDVGTALVSTPLWQSGKQSFPSVFPPICLVFISRPPTYKGKLSSISIFRFFIAFGSGTLGGCANLCQGFGKKKSPHPLERYWEPVTAAATPVLRRLPVLWCMNKSKKCLNLQLFCFFQFLIDLCFLSFSPSASYKEENR